MLIFAGGVQTRKNIPKKTSAEMQKKCKETGCWLFLYSEDALTNLLVKN
jgi:hypothetical protein